MSKREAIGTVGAILGLIVIISIVLVYGQKLHKQAPEYPGTGAIIANEETQKIVDKYREENPIEFYGDIKPCPVELIDTDGNCLDSK